MRISYLSLPLSVASARLRGLIPARELQRLGFEISKPGEGDWIVLQKHGWDFEPSEKVVFDICDDHFHSEHEAHYRKWAAKADKVTCNSTVMAEIIKAETGRDATVIPDPYESPEYLPRCHLPALWFGHRSNLPDLLPYLERLPELIVVSDVNARGVIPWSPQVMAESFNRAGLVVIPTGKKQAKSANRAIESIRRGLYPVCGRLPAYDELGLGEDDLIEGVEKAMADPQATAQRIIELQALVRDQFSPKTIGAQWASVFD